MELCEIRAKIDAVDDQLLSLFLERMALSEETEVRNNEFYSPARVFTGKTEMA